MKTFNQELIYDYKDWYCFSSENYMNTHSFQISQRKMTSPIVISMKNVHIYIYHLKEKHTFVQILCCEFLSLVAKCFLVSLVSFLLQ